MAKRLSKKRRTAVISATSGIYSEVCRQVSYSLERAMIHKTYEPGEKELKEIAEKEAVINDEYRKRICELPTTLLNDILIANELGIFKRKENTIDAIHGELLERALNGNKRKNTR